MSDEAVGHVGAAVSATLKRASGWWLVRAAVSIALGVLVLIWPNEVIKAIAIIGGAYIAVLGVLRLVEGITSKTATTAARTANVVLGVLLLVLGVVVMLNPAFAASMVMILIGVSWVIEGIATIAGVAQGSGSWPTVILGALIAVAGVLVVMFASELLVAYVVFIGLALIAVGVVEVVLFFAARSSVKRA